MITARHGWEDQRRFRDRGAISRTYFQIPTRLEAQKAD